VTPRLWILALGLLGAPALGCSSNPAGSLSGFSSFHVQGGFARAVAGDGGAPSALGVVLWAHFDGGGALANACDAPGVAFEHLVRVAWVTDGGVVRPGTTPIGNGVQVVLTENNAVGGLSLSAKTGSVTLDALSDAQITGHFAATLTNLNGQTGTLKGDFDVPLCAGSATLCEIQTCQPGSE